MVVTSAMGSVLASKRARERDEMYAMQELGNAMAAAAGNIAQAEMAEKDRRQQLLMYEEEKQYERKWQEDERKHKRFQADLDRQNKQHAARFNMMAKVAGTTGEALTEEEAASMGLSPGEFGILGRIAAETKRQNAMEKAARAEEKEAHEATVALRKAQTGAIKQEGARKTFEAGTERVKAYGKAIGGALSALKPEKMKYTGEAGQWAMLNQALEDNEPWAADALNAKLLDIQAKKQGIAGTTEFLAKQDEDFATFIQKEGAKIALEGTNDLAVLRAIGVYANSIMPTAMKEMGTKIATEMVEGLTPEKRQEKVVDHLNALGEKLVKEGKMRSAREIEKLRDQYVEGR